MTALKALLALALAVAVQTGAGQLWAGSALYLDVMIVPVVCYGIAGSQRSAMFMGFGAGLLQDAWFDSGVFGLHAFKKTLLGWLLGGLGARFDLNGQGGRLVCGIGLSALDSLLDFGLRELMDQQQTAPRPWVLVARAVLAGVMVMAAFGLEQRLARRRRRRLA